MPVVPRSSSLLSPSRAEFSQSDFSNLIQQYGYDVRWSKFMLCANFNPEQPEHHMPDCTFCDHAGRMFYDPQITRMFASSFAVKPIYGQESRYDHGTVYFTTLPGAAVSYRDRIELLTSRIRYSERFLLTGSLTYRPRFAALSVQAAVTNTNQSVPLTTVHANLDGTISFTALPVGAAFVSIAYDHHPVYTVVDVMHVVRDSRTTQMEQDVPTEFNRQVVAQLEFTRDTGDPNSADLA